MFHSFYLYLATPEEREETADELEDEGFHVQRLCRQSLYAEKEITLLPVQ